MPTKQDLLDRIKEEVDKRGLKGDEAMAFAKEKQQGFNQILSRGVKAAATLGGSEIARDPNLSEFLGKKVPESALSFGGGVASAVKHPIETAKTLGSVVAGGVQKLIPGEQGMEDNFDAFANIYIDRYGDPRKLGTPEGRADSMERIRETAYNDPVGFLADISLVLDSTGGAIKVAGKASKIGMLSKTGGAISKAGQIINPATMAFKVAGKGIKEVGKGARKLTQPFVKSLKKDLLNIAKEMGVEIPTSIIDDTKLFKAISQKLDDADTFQNKLDVAKTQLDSFADDITKVGDSTGDLSVVGRTISDKFLKFRETYFKTKAELYGKIDMNGVKVVPQQALDWIDDLIAKKTRAKKGGALVDSELRMLRKRRRQIVGRTKKGPVILDERGTPIDLDTIPKGANTITGQEAKNAISEINKSINFKDPVSQGLNSELQKLAELLDNDLDIGIKASPNGNTILDQIDKANTAFKDGRLSLNSKWGRSINNLTKTQQYDKIIPSILNPKTSIDDIPRILEAIGADNIGEVQAGYMKHMFDKARVNGNINPNTLNKNLHAASRTKLEMILTPEQIQAVDNIAKVSKSLSSAKQIAGRSNPVAVMRLGNVMASSGFVARGNIQVALAMILGVEGFNLFAKTKIGNKLIQQAINVPGTTANIAGRAVEGTGKTISGLSVPLGKATVATSILGKQNERTR